MRTNKGRIQLAVDALISLIMPVVSSAKELDRFRLSPPALHVARIIGVEPLLLRLSIIIDARELDATSMTLEELSIHQQITEAVVVASLDVDSVMDQIDNERAQIVESCWREGNALSAPPILPPSH